MKKLGVIPARYASERLPGKPLAQLGGKPLVQHVYERCKRAPFDRIVVATDDLRIAAAVKNFGGEAIMTSPDAPSGTDRVMEALSVLEGQDAFFDIVVNIQGDEPFIDPEGLSECIAVLEEDPRIDVATLAQKISDPLELLDPNVVKVVDDFDHNAIYFSRSLIPYPRQYRKKDGSVDHDEAFRHTVFLKHIGVYAYRKSSLVRFVSMPPSPLEMIERLEQLRILQAGGRIRIIEIQGLSIGVDTEEDLRKAERMMKAAAA